MRPDLNHFTRPARPPALGDIARQLRELPAELTPPYDFAEFQRRGREASTRTGLRVSWPHAAAAAGLTAVVAAVALFGTRGGPTSHDAGTAAAPAAGEGMPAVPNESSIAYTNTRALPQLAAHGNSSLPISANGANGTLVEAGVDEDASDRARAAREWLARQPAEPALVRAGSRLTVAGLEDRIAWFDDALTDQRLHGADPTQMKVLQQERARLVSSLAQVRFAEALVANGS